MTVIFRATPTELTEQVLYWYISCQAQPERDHRRFRTEQLAEAGAADHGAYCHDEHCGGAEVWASHADAGEPYAEMSKTNVCLVLRALGLLTEVGAEAALEPRPDEPPPAPEGPDPAQEGEITADDLLGRIVLALGMAPQDEGVPPYESSPRWIECGREPGYLQRKLEELAELAEYARAGRRAVYWH
jgi:hypothetical protein